jgi:hypothetical protein
MRAVFDWTTLEWFDEEYIATRFAWAFLRDGDFSSPVVWKEVPITHCYVKSGCQEIKDSDIREVDMRSWTCDVHTARQKNADEGRPWMTDWELEQAEQSAKYEASLALV